MMPEVRRLMKLSTNKKGEVQRKKLQHVTYPAAAMPYLQAVFTAHPAPQAATEV